MTDFQFLAALFVLTACVVALVARLASRGPEW
jgi:hypothetical protein